MPPNPPRPDVDRRGTDPQIWYCPGGGKRDRGVSIQLDQLPEVQARLRAESSGCDVPGCRIHGPTGQRCT